MINKDKRESTNKNFGKAKNFVKEWYDLDLTLIEQSELRKIVEHTTKLYIEDKKRYVKKRRDEKYQINPSLEAMYIFMNKNYGAKIQDYGDLYSFNLKRDNCIREIGYDMCSEEFKILQEKKYLP